MGFSECARSTPAELSISTKVTYFRYTAELSIMFQGHIFSNKQCSSGCLPFSAGCAAKSAARCIPYVQVAQQKQSSQHMSPEEIFQIVLIFNFDRKKSDGVGHFERATC